MKRIFHVAIALSALSLLAATTPPKPPQGAENAIDQAGLLEHIKVIGSDKFEGRAPGSKGEEESINYITAQFKTLGLRPGNADGTYTQEVPLAGILTTPAATFTVGDQKMELHSPNEFVAFTQQITPQIKVDDSEMVFVGYGIEAPE